MKKVLVTGGAGFIGNRLARFLKKRDNWVRVVDKNDPKNTQFIDQFWSLDLTDKKSAKDALRDVDFVYHLAANMGGIGFISENHAEVASENTNINLNVLEAAVSNDVNRLFFASSACVYPTHIQQSTGTDLKESDALPADPERGYGWEKLYAEQLCDYFREDYGLDTRVARFHNVYGPGSKYQGGKEKVVAALCRKIARVEDGGTINVWGDGKQTRSFLFVDDCVKGMQKIMSSNCSDPVNLGSDRSISIDDLVNLITNIAGKNVKINHDKSKPQGVRGRNSDNSKLREVVGWEPETSLKEGLKRTYTWVNKQVSKQ